MEHVYEIREDILHNHFSSIKKWSISDICASRRTWIEVHGILPLGWQRDNFVKIGGLWGDVICMDKEAEQANSMESAKLVLDTCQMATIEETIVMQVGKGGYEVHVREIWAKYRDQPSVGKGKITRNILF